MDLLIIGDSLSQDPYVTAGSAFAGWPSVLGRLVGLDVQSIAVAGSNHFYWIAAAQLARAASLQPAKGAIVLLGTNDFKLGVLATTLWANVSAICGLYRTYWPWAGRIHVGTPPPRNDLAPAEETERLAYNAIVRARTDIVPVDFARMLDPLDGGILDPDIDIGDGIHPNAPRGIGFMGLCAAAEIQI